MGQRSVPVSVSGSRRRHAGRDPTAGTKATLVPASEADWVSRLRSEIGRKKYDVHPVDDGAAAVCEYRHFFAFRV